MNRFDNPFDTNAAPYTAPSRKTWFSFPSSMFALFIIVAYGACIIALFALNAKKSSSGDTNTNLYSVTASWFPTKTVTDNAVVSLSSDGYLLQGGGTTIYKNEVVIPQTCSKYLGVHAVYQDTYIVNNVNPQTKLTYFSVVTVGSSPDQQSLVNSVANPTAFYDIKVLQPSTGLLVGLSQLDGTESNVAVIRAARLSRNPYTLTVGPSAKYANCYSFTPQITRVSDSTFAISYYNQTSDSLTAWVATRFGMVNPTTLAITLSQPYYYVNNLNFGISHSLTGLTATRWLLVTYDSSINTAESTGPLAVYVATLTNSDGLASAAAANVSVIGPYTLAGSAAGYFFSVDRISANTAMVSYFDATRNFAVTAQCVSLFPSSQNPGFSVSFDAVYPVTQGQAAVVLANYSQMTLKVRTISTDGRFVVLFSDTGNYGASTVFVGQYVSGSIQKYGPVYTLNSGNPNVLYTSFWPAVAAGSLDNDNVQAALMTVISDRTCRSVGTSMFSILEMMPRPLGVKSSPLTSIGQNANYQIVISGAVGGVSTPVSASLNTGMVYLSDTMGQTIPSGLYYGHKSSKGYIEVNGTVKANIQSSVLITLDSAVGVAAGPETLSVFQSTN